MNHNKKKIILEIKDSSIEYKKESKDRLEFLKEKIEMAPLSLDAIYGRIIKVTYYMSENLIKSKID